MIGVTIARVDIGYFLDLTAVPKNLSRPDICMLNQKLPRELMLETLNGVVKAFVMKVKVLPVQLSRKLAWPIWYA